MAKSSKKRIEHIRVMSRWFSQEYEDAPTDFWGRSPTNTFKHSNGYPVLLLDIDEACRFEEHSTDHNASFIKLEGHRLNELPYYSEAKKSAKANYRQVMADRYPKGFHLVRGRSHRAKRENFFSWLGLSGDTLPLPQHVKVVEEAARIGDQDFFLRMAQVIQARSKRAFPTTPKIKMTFYWVKSLLWLMPDHVGLTHLRNNIYCSIPENFKITLDTYTKTRQRLKLFQHPKPPITGVTVNGDLIGLDKLLSSLSR